MDHKDQQKVASSIGKGKGLKNAEIASEIKPKKLHGKPPLGRASEKQIGLVELLPNGVIDQRDHNEDFVIPEHADEYGNFDNNSFFEHFSIQLLSLAVQQDFLPLFSERDGELLSLL